MPHQTEKIHLALYSSKKIIRIIKRSKNNNNGVFSCLNFFHAYRTKPHQKICENHDYCHVEMSNEHNEIIKYNQGEKSIISPFIIYADLECLLEKISTCYNNPKESSTTEINKHTPSGNSLFTHCSFDKTKTKLDYYRDEDCMKKFCLDLREHAIKLIIYEKKKMIPLRNKEEKNYDKQKICYIYKKEFNTDDSDKKHHKVKHHCHYTGEYRRAAHNICNLR